MKIANKMNTLRDNLTGIEEVTNWLADFDAIIKEVEALEVEPNICDKLQAALTDTGKAHNPYDNGWNAALRFAIAEFELATKNSPNG